MDPIILPHPATPIRQQLDFYRAEKYNNSKIARNIDTIKHCCYDSRMQSVQCQILVSELTAREAALSPLGNRICMALLRVPDPIDQMAVELRYLQLLPMDAVAAELGCSTTTVRHRINRAIMYMQPL